MERKKTNETQRSALPEGGAEPSEATTDGGAEAAPAPPGR